MREEPFAEKSLMDLYKKRFLSEEQPEKVILIKIPKRYYARLKYNRIMKLSRSY